MAADCNLPPCPQLDREHKVAGLFPRPTFKDKSTYVESSTKVYDDVSVPTVGLREGLQVPTRSWGPRTWLGCLPIGRQPHTSWLASYPLVSPACHIYFLAKSRVPRATWKFPRAGLPHQVWVCEGGEQGCQVGPKELGPSPTLCPTDGIPVPVLDPLPTPGVLCRLQPPVPGAQGLVLLGAQHALWLPADLR